MRVGLYTCVSMLLLGAETNAASSGRDLLYCELKPDCLFYNTVSGDNQVATLLATFESTFSLPYYDYVAWCTKQTAGDDQRSRCIAVERRSLDKLLTVQSHSHGTFLTQCDSEMRPVDSYEFSYSVLLSCMEIKMGTPF